MTQPPTPSPQDAGAPASVGHGAPLWVQPRSKTPSAFGRGFGLGTGLAIGAGLIVTVLSILPVLFIGLLGALVSPGDSSGQSDLVWGPSGADHKILAIPIEGAIVGQSNESGGFTMASVAGYDIAARLDKLDKDDYDGVILEMNTPGGTIYGAKAISDAVTRYQERTGNKVVAYVRGVSASGGMYAMAGADKIIADHGTFIGSIGVIMGPITTYQDVVSESGLLGEGVETRGGIVKEYFSRGKGKDFGNPYRPPTDEERAVYGQGLDNEYAKFVKHVSDNREIPENVIRDDIGAYLYGPTVAAQKKLIDDVMGQDEAFKNAAELMGADPSSTHVVRVKTPGMLASLLGAKTTQSDSSEGRQKKTPVLCTQGPTVLAWHGDPKPLCG